MSETSKGFIANNWFKLFLVALSLFLIAMYFHRESQLDDCLQFAHQNYQEAWGARCKEEKQNPQCSLPRFMADILGKDKEKQTNECYRRYSFK